MALSVGKDRDSKLARIFCPSISILILKPEGRREKVLPWSSCC